MMVFHHTHIVTVVSCANGEYCAAGELVMDVLHESRVTQLNKLIGLPPTAKPAMNEVSVLTTCELYTSKDKAKKRT